MQHGMALAPIGKKPGPNKKIVLIVIVVLVVALPSIFLLRGITQGGPPSSVIVSGSATAGIYGTAIGVAFLQQSRNESMYQSKVVNGQYSVKVPNDYSYLVLIDFQPPNGSPSGTCSTVTILVNQQAGNSSLTSNWSCFPPYRLPNT